MDFNKTKYKLSKISGIIAIVISTVFLAATLADLIEVLNMTEIVDPGYVILTHVIWVCVNLLLLGFGISARMKPVLRLRKGIMGERKKYFWFYGKLRNKLGLAALSIVLFVLCFKMSEIFAISKSVIGGVLEIVQLVICPCYIAVAVLQVLGAFVKDPRLYDGDYKLITKEDSAFEFYSSLQSKGKSYNGLKYLTGKLAGALVMANGILILIESIYTFIDLLRNGLAFGISDWKVFVIDLVIIVGKIVLSVILLSKALSLGEKPTQKVVSTEYYQKGMDREFRWKYVSPITLVITAVFSLAIAVISLIADANIKLIIHPVIMQLGVVLTPMVMVYYVSTAVFILTAILCITSLAIKDKKIYKLEANIFNIMAGIE